MFAISHPRWLPKCSLYEIRFCVFALYNITGEFKVSVLFTFMLPFMFSAILKNRLKIASF